MTRSLLFAATFTTLILAAGCGSTFGDLPETPDATACAVPVGGGDPSNGLDITFDATITEAGLGTSPDDCLSGWGRIGTRDEVDSTNAIWFRASDADGNAWTVEMLIADLPAASVGETITGTILFNPQPFGPSSGSLQLARDEARWVYLGQHGSPENLDTPADLSFARGEAIYEQRDDCGRWRAYDMDATVDGAGVTIEYGKTVVAGDQRITHAGLEHDTTTSSQCADWFVANVVVAAIPN